MTGKYPFEVSRCSGCFGYETLKPSCIRCKGLGTIFTYVGENKGEHEMSLRKRIYFNNGRSMDADIYNMTLEQLQGLAQSLRNAREEQLRYRIAGARASTREVEGGA